MFVNKWRKSRECVCVCVCLCVCVCVCVHRPPMSRTLSLFTVELITTPPILFHTMGLHPLTLHHTHPGPRSPWGISLSEDTHRLHHISSHHHVTRPCGRPCPRERPGPNPQRGLLQLHGRRPLRGCDHHWCHAQHQARHC